MEIKVYTKSGCPFCDMAKKWLDENGFEYESVLMDNEEERLALYQSINGISENIGNPPDVRRVNSVPQIFIDGDRIGGYDDLMKYAETLFKKRGSGSLLKFSETYKPFHYPWEQLKSQQDMRKYTGLRMNLTLQKMYLIGSLVKLQNQKKSISLIF